MTETHAHCMRYFRLVAADIRKKFSIAETEITAAISGVVIDGPLHVVTLDNGHSWRGDACCGHKAVARTWEDFEKKVEYLHGALASARENGYDELVESQDPEEITSDLMDCDSEAEKMSRGTVLAAAKLWIERGDCRSTVR